MRIVQVLENLDVGGLERVAIDLALAQKAAGHEPSFYCLFEAGQLAREAESAGVPITCFHKKPGFSPRLVLRLAGQLRRDSPHVVHSHNSGAHIYTALAATVARVPAVVNTRHGFINSQAREYSESHFRAVMPFTGAVVSVSEHTQRYFVDQRIVPAAKARTIWNGIPIEKFLAQAAKPGSEAPRIRFGTVGRMVPVKGHGMLLEAFAQVVRRIPQATLRIAGDGPLHGEAAAQIERLGLQSSVILEGLRHDVAQFLSELDVFVLSSTNEGLPIVILEAMAAGLPIVSTRVGGVPEVAEEGVFAWYAPSGEAAALAEAMCAAAQAPLAEVGQISQRKAIESFSIATMARNYEDLYRSLLPAGVR